MLLNKITPQKKNSYEYIPVAYVTMYSMTWFNYTEFHSLRGTVGLLIIYSNGHTK